MCLAFEKNLLFVKQLDHAKGKITIKFSNCKSLKGIEIAQCILEVDFYKLGVNNKQKCNETTFPIIIDMNKTNLWHLGLGHINQRRLKKNTIYVKRSIVFSKEFISLSFMHQNKTT
jgi:hypothetical protein